MTTFSQAFRAAGGNRHPSAADWKPGLFAFGAGKNLAIWNVDDDGRGSVSQLLSGHTDDVNAVRIFDSDGGRCIITGSSDKTVRIWRLEGEGRNWECVQVLEGHAGSVNAVATLEEKEVFVSGAADGSCKVWSFSGGEAKLDQTLTLKPRYLALSCALAALEDGAVVLAVAGTTNSIQLYARPTSDAEFHLQATLTGHEGWIRSLDFVKAGPRGDLLLASASQDKYIRLWRFSTGHAATTNGAPDPATAVAKKSLSNKAHQVGGEGNKYTVTFEALLIGHEDWIYTVRWVPSPPSSSSSESKSDDLRLLSSSADNSLAIWRPDPTSGIWICETRLGEISAQKGSTTATGSTGGFWIGLWQPDGKGVVSLGRTGSWRRWWYEGSSDVWQQGVGISGHVKEVQGLAWAPDGNFLLSTGSDQTTRLWAEWQADGEGGRTSWHEFARPQIHGYDLNCIATLSPSTFVSGADEKLLRVFDKPKAVSDLLIHLCGHDEQQHANPDSGAEDLPNAANIPVLGLSNKAISPTSPEGDESPPLPNDGTTPSHPPTHPPLEDALSRQTLFPEHDKLYGHGYEISALASSPTASLIATACKASSLDHAVIRLYSSDSWREIKPALKGHSLTVTGMGFHSEGEWLVSCGRDRAWCLWRKGVGKEGAWGLWKVEGKGHSRMMLDCAWAPREVGLVFATAGRDKVVKIWKVDPDARSEGDKVKHFTTITASSAVTAIDFAPTTCPSGRFQLAYGTETGSTTIAALSTSTLGVLGETALDKDTAPSATVNTLRWRPHAQNGANDEQQLAIASDDSSVRIVNVHIEGG